MKQISLTYPTKETICPILIGENILGEIGSFFNLNTYSKTFVITDQNMETLCLRRVMKFLPRQNAYIVMISGEKEKNIESIGKIWTAMHKEQCDRKSLVINVGGGVICDMGGFAASTYMRGIDFIHVPTTLLAQVDASIGGKTGVNFSGVKNLIGTFDQPIGVIIDTQTLTTLPRREFLSGFAEIMKHGLIKDTHYFEIVTAKHPLQFTQDEIIDIIARSIEIKADIVQNDETESGARKLLNFGHTIGHAIEALSLESTTPLLHGEAISIGMQVEARISHLAGLLSISDLEKIEEALTAVGLPVSRPGTNVELILKKIQSDKKNEGGKVNLTLLRSIGDALYNQHVPRNIIINALEKS